MFRHHLILIFGFLIAVCWLSITPVRTPAAPGKEKNPPAQAVPVAPGVIKAEANMVLVDVVVTDKKKHYLQDLTQKDFHVFEDGKEQPITSFSREADIKPGSPGRQRYMVLLFDNASLDPEGQMWERDAASKFVESTASPQRMMAVMDYGGDLRTNPANVRHREGQIEVGRKHGRHGRGAGCRRPRPAQSAAVHSRCRQNAGRRSGA